MSFIFTMIYDPFSSINYSISHNAFSFHRMIQFLHLKYTFGFFQLLLILSAADCFVSLLLASNIFRFPNKVQEKLDDSVQLSFFEIK